jgi:hypothetical protein
VNLGSCRTLPYALILTRSAALAIVSSALQLVTALTISISERTDMRVCKGVYLHVLLAGGTKHMTEWALGEDRVEDGDVQRRKRIIPWKYDQVCDVVPLPSYLISCK